MEVKGVVMPRKLHSWESPRCYRFSITHNVALVSQVGPLLKGSPHTCGVTFSQWRGPLSLVTDPHQFHMCFIRPPAVPIGEELNLRCCSHAVSRSQEHFLNINILWVYIHNCSKLFKCTSALQKVIAVFLHFCQFLFFFCSLSLCCPWSFCFKLCKCHWSQVFRQCMHICKCWQLRQRERPLCYLICQKGSFDPQKKASTFNVLVCVLS